MRHLDVPNLRGRYVRDVQNDHTRGRDISKRREAPKDRNTESDDEFDFGLAEEAEGESTEDFEKGHKGSSRKKKLKQTKLGGDEAIKGEKTEDELETTNSD